MRRRLAGGAESRLEQKHARVVAAVDVFVLGRAFKQLPVSVAVTGGEQPRRLGGKLGRGGRAGGDRGSSKAECHRREPFLRR